MGLSLLGGVSIEEFCGDFVEESTAFDTGENGLGFEGPFQCVLVRLDVLLFGLLAQLLCLVLSGLALGRRQILALAFICCGH